MNIVYHFRVRGIGAEAVHIAGIAGGWAQLGHDVQFVSPSGIDPLRAPAPVPAATTTPQHATPAWVRLLHGLADHAPQLAFEALEIAYNAVAVPRLLRALTRWQPELLYERHAFFNVAGSIAAGRRKIPHVVEVNELSGYERARDQKLVGLAQRAERFVFQRARLVVCVSDFLTERVRELTEGRVPAITIPNAVGREWLEAKIPEPELVALRQRLGLGDEPVVGFVGALIEWHNFPLLLQAFQQARARVPRAVLLIVGDGRERRTIEAHAERLGVRQALRFTGRVSHPEVRRLIELCQVTVIPQSNAFRSPIKMFEYMAASKPVVAPGTEPILDVLEHGRTGLIFDASGRGLGEAITAALTDEALARRLGRAARAEVEARYTWEAHSRRILEESGLSEERRGVRHAAAE